MHERMKVDARAHTHGHLQARLDRHMRAHDHTRTRARAHAQRGYNPFGLFLRVCSRMEATTHRVPRASPPKAAGKAAGQVC